MEASVQKRTHKLSTQICSLKPCKAFFNPVNQTSAFFISNLDKGTSLIPTSTSSASPIQGVQHQCVPSIIIKLLMFSYSVQIYAHLSVHLLYRSCSLTCKQALLLVHL